MADFASDAVVRLAPAQVSTHVDGETVILDLEAGHYYGMNPVGSRIWELLEQPRTVGAIESTLIEEFDVDRDRLHADMNAFLTELSAKGLIQVAPQSA